MALGAGPGQLIDIDKDALGKNHNDRGSSPSTQGRLGHPFPGHARPGPVSRQERLDSDPGHTPRP
jgi:hypothetical protein